jgi:hypothetical protein
MNTPPSGPKSNSCKERNYQSRFGRLKSPAPRGDLIHPLHTLFSIQAADPNLASSPMPGWFRTCRTIKLRDYYCWLGASFRFNKWRIPSSRVPNRRMLAGSGTESLPPTRP